MNKVLSLLILWLTALTVHAKLGHVCAEAQQHRHRHAAAKIALASPLLDLYDVTHLKLDLQMSHLLTDVSGSATTTGRVVDSGGMGRYAFELSGSLVIDSVLLNGTRLPVLLISTDLYVVTPPAAIPRGALFAAQVFYHGTPKNGTGFFTNGVNQKMLGTGTNVTFTLSDPYLAKDWWPCKQSLTDKIDSADLWFTVPNTVKAGSNGLLKAVVPNGPLNRYQWKTAYPIEYYLVSVCIAPYVESRQTVYFTGSTDSMLLQHYIYDTATMYPLYKSAIDSTPGMVNYFSTLYGRYPFWKEKYGHCTAPLSGGMENQTMTTLGAYTTPLIAHELGHQWWGDALTYATWRDIWMSEGWASYSEQLYIEHFRSIADARAYRTGVFSRVMGSAGGSVYVDDTTDVYRIFDSRLTYDKGAAVAHMLRYMAPSDAVFFGGLKSFQQQYAYRTATTADFQAYMQTAYGFSLDSFFRQWVYGEGFPTYTATWNQKGGEVFVLLQQSTSRPGSVSAFNLPVELMLTSSAGDTVVRVNFNSANQLFRFNWTKAMNGVVIDPYNDIVNRATPVFIDPTLSVSASMLERVTVYPNPTRDSWHVGGILPGSTLKLYDAAGKIVWVENNPTSSVVIDSKTLAPGIYSLSLQHNKMGVVTKVLQKR